MRGEDGWHTFYLRRCAHAKPLPRLADVIREALAYGALRLLSLGGKPWRRLGAVLRQHA